jgi:response regulator RpfG family c-di-GMP phosphodiesterase
VLSEQAQVPFDIHRIVENRVESSDRFLWSPCATEHCEHLCLRSHQSLIIHGPFPSLPSDGAETALVRASHERWDGTGYPDVCDAYSAMTSPRPYRRELTSSEAVAELQRCAGSQFDATVAPALRQVLDSVPPRLLSEA